MKRQIKRLLTSLLTVLLLTTVMSINVLAEDTFTMSRVPGGTQKDVYVGNERRVVYCMQYDNVWPITEDGYATVKTNYSAASSVTLLDDDQLQMISRVLFAGYPYDAKGILKPLYDMLGSDAKESAADLTQDVIWSLMAQWEVDGNTHYLPPSMRGEETIPGGDDIFNELLDYAENGEPLTELPVDFNAELSGSTIFMADSEGVATTGALQISNPEGYKLMYKLEVPEDVWVLNADGEYAIPELDFNNGEWVVTGYYVYGEDPFYLQTDNPEAVAGEMISYSAELKLPGTLQQYVTKDKIWANKNDGQGYVMHPAQTMLSIGIVSESYEGEVEIAETGSLTVTKNIDTAPSDLSGNESFWFEASITLPNSNEQFNSWVPFTKTHSNGSESEGRLYHFGDKMRFELFANETITIRDLPAGANYTVREYGLTEVPDPTNNAGLGNWTPVYNQAAGTVTADGVSGVISTDGSLVTVTNSYNDPIVPAELSFAGTKTIFDVDNDVNIFDEKYNNAFRFTMFGVLGNEPMPEGSEYNSATERVEFTTTNSPNTVDATVTNIAANSYSLNFGTITFDKAGEYSYTIEEEPTSVSDISKDMSHWHVTVSVIEGDENELVATPEYIHHHDDTHEPSPEGCAHDSLTFTNTYRRNELDEEIQITKVVHNNSSSLVLSRAGYSFTIRPAEEDTDKYPDFADGSKTVVATTGASGEAFSGVMKFTDEWFEEFESDNTVKLVYNITEDKPENADDAISYDTRTAQAVITITKIEDEYRSDIEYRFLTDVNGNPIEEDLSSTPIVFVNSYEASGELKLQISKEFNGDYDPSGETYEFKINDNFNRNDKTGYELPRSNVRVNFTADRQPTISGDKIIFNKAGDYRFLLTEVKGEDAKEGMIYDTKSWIVDVEVNDDGQGNLFASAKYFHEGGSSSAQDKAIFTNTYVSKVETELTISKELLGRDWKDDDHFRVTISHSTNGDDPCHNSAHLNEHTDIKHPYSAVLTAESNSTVLDGIEFYKEGTYYLDIKEYVPSDNSEMIYDPTVYVVEYKIEKDGNDLKISETNIFDATNGWANRKKLVVTELTFTNKVTNFTLEKADNEGSKDAEFAFTLKLNTNQFDEENKPVYVTDMTFGDLHFDSKGEAVVDLKRGEKIQVIGLPDGMTVEVSEALTANNTASYIVTNGDSSSAETVGSLASVKIEAGKAQKIVFTNTVVGDLKISKKIEAIGDDLNDEFMFTLKLLKDADVATISGIYGDLEFKNGVAEFSLGNNGSVTVSNLPKGLGYEVSENSDSRYTSTVTQNATGTIGVENIEVEFTNTRKTGSLTVSKTVTAAGNDLNDKFEFTITLTDRSDINGTFDNVTFTDGVAKVILGNGESKTITGLPAGTAYTVSEKNDDRYDVTSNGVTGTITEDGVSADFTNTRKTGDLSVTKSVVAAGTDLETGFNFTVKLSRTDINGTFGDMTFKDGIAKVTLKNAETAVAKGLPEGTAYSVSEERNSSYVASSSNTRGVIGTGEVSKVSFTNIRKTGGLEITKKTVGLGNDLRRSFSFTVVLSRTDINGQYGDLFFRNGVARFTLNNGKTVRAYGLPSGTTYKVSEESDSRYTSESVNDEGEISAYDVEKISFTNTRKTGSLTVSKEVVAVGSDLDDTFEFTLTLVNRKDINATISGVKFVRGTAKIALANGESKTIGGLPAGIEYTVTEAEDARYTVESDNESGVIVSDDVTEVSFTNIRKTGGFSVTKSLVAVGDDNNTVFDFTAVLSRKDITGTYGDLYFEEGVAVFRLGKDDSVEVSGLPSGTEYRISEKTVDLYVSEADGAAGVVTADMISEVIFVNTRKTGNIEVTKIVKGEETTRKFAFTITLSREDINGVFGDVEFTDGVAEFELGHEETVEITGLPSDCEYEVTENQVSGYRVASENSTGTVASDETALVTFANTKIRNSTVPYVVPNTAAK